MKMFNLSIFPKRYFVINFKFARLIIYHNKEDEKSGKTILFRDILSCEDTKGKNTKDGTSPFIIKTSERQYILVAPTSMEKQIWIDAFSYIIPSTQALQDIIRINETRIHN